MGTGGFRYGAGRPGWRRKCENSMAFDIRRLKLRGRLVPGQRYTWRWTRDDEWVGNVGVATYADRLEIDYTWTPRDCEPRPVRCCVPIEATPCHFGGGRKWFRCPRCFSRRAVLYFGGPDFACRCCLRLAYLSECLSPLDRLWRKQSKLEARLGLEGERPKRMRWRTYERLLDRIDAIEAAKDEVWWPQFARLAQRLGCDPEQLLTDER